MAIPANLQKKIAEAKMTAGGNNIKDGDYEFVVKQIICEAKYKGTFFIPEFDVLKAQKTHSTIEPNTVGSDCSAAWPLDTNGPAGEAAKGNIKQFLCGLFDLPESVGMEEIMKVANDYAGPAGSEDALRARGMLVRASTFRKAVKSGPNVGKEGCYPRFSPVTDQTPEQVAERRKKLDADAR